MVLRRDGHQAGFFSKLESPEDEPFCNSTSLLPESTRALKSSAWLVLCCLYLVAAISFVDPDATPSSCVFKVIREGYHGGQPKACVSARRGRD